MFAGYRLFELFACYLASDIALVFFEWFDDWVYFKVWVACARLVLGSET